MKLKLKDKEYDFANKKFIMGILNITPDSFSDGGDNFSLDMALKSCEEMLEAGADIIDVGGESTRPNSLKVSLSEERKRVIPVIKELKKRFHTLISIDTYKEEVADEAIKEGADIINDISGLTFSKNMASIAAKHKVPVIISHIKGTPQNMQENPIYEDVVAEIKDFFETQIQYALDKGVDREQIILDPGIGFGKTYEHNIEILKSLKQFLSFDLPLLIGLSRKRFLGEISGLKNPKDRDLETIIASLHSLNNGADIVRVHNVKLFKRALKVTEALA